MPEMFKYPIVQSNTTTTHGLSLLAPNSTSPMSWGAVGLISRQWFEP
jgi:hypothetical protein